MYSSSSGDSTTITCFNLNSISNTLKSHSFLQVLCRNSVFFLHPVPIPHRFYILSGTSETLFPIVCVMGIQDKRTTCLLCSSISLRFFTKKSPVFFTLKFDTIKGSACSYSDICTAFLKPYNTLEHTSIIIKPYVYLETQEKCCCLPKYSHMKVSQKSHFKMKHAEKTKNVRKSTAAENVAQAVCMYHLQQVESKQYRALQFTCRYPAYERKTKILQRVYL